MDGSPPAALATIQLTNSRFFLQQFPKVGLNPKLYTVFPQPNGAVVLLSTCFSHEYRLSVELALANFAMA